MEFSKVSRVLDVLGEETDSPEEGLELLTNVLGALIVFYEDDPDFKKKLEFMEIKIVKHDTEAVYH